MNLHGQLSGGREDERERAGSPAASPLRALHGRAAHDAADDGEAEGGRLPGPGLRAGHEVAAGQRDRDGVPLHGGGPHVLAAADVVVERGAEVDLRERADGGGHLPAAGLDGDVLVRVEVDPGVLVLVEPLGLRVGEERRTREARGRSGCGGGEGRRRSGRSARGRRMLGPERGRARRRRRRPRRSWRGPPWLAGSARRRRGEGREEAFCEIV